MSRYEPPPGVAWVVLPVLTMLMAAGAHAGWAFVSWMLR